MADPLAMFNTALAGLNLANPLSAVINIILATIIGGIVFLIIAEIIAKAFREEIQASHAFVVVLVINIINMFGVLNLVPFISILPAFLLQIIIWIVLVKLAFRNMAITHVILLSIIGWLVTILIIPYLVGMASGFIPKF